MSEHEDDMGGMSALPGLSGPRPDTFGPVPEIPGYEIIAPLGHGGMGVVYKARQLRPNRIVAVKLMAGGMLARRSERLRFEREAQAVADLKHPGIVTVYDFGEAVGHLYMSMEFVDGLPLTAHVRKHQPSLRSKAALMQRICEAVAHAHQNGVIHRDLKPANILVTDAGRSKVLDFGLAKLSAVAGAAAQLTLTGQGQMLGTVPYMAPEQTGGAGAETDVRTDVFALGVVFYQMLTGRLPHSDESTNSLEVMRRIRDESPQRPYTIVRAVGGDIETIVLKALAKDKQRRYQSVAALATDIGRYLAGQPIEARRASLGYQMRKFAVRHRWRLIPVVAALLAVCTTGVWAFVRVASERNTAREAQALAEQRTQEAQDALTVTNLFHTLTPPETASVADHFRNLEQIESFLADNAANTQLRQVEQRRTDDRKALAEDIHTDLRTNDLADLASMCAANPSRVEVIRHIDSEGAPPRLLARVQKRLQESLLTPAPIGRAQFMRDIITTLLAIDSDDPVALRARAERNTLWQNMTPLISENFDTFKEGEHPPGWDGSYGSEVAEVRGEARELFVHSEYGNAGAIRLPLKLPEGTRAVWARAEFRFLPGGTSPMDGALRFSTAPEQEMCAVECQEGIFVCNMVYDGVPQQRSTDIRVVAGQTYRLELRCFPQRGTFDALIDGRFVVEEAKMEHAGDLPRIFELKSNAGTQVFVDNVEVRASTQPMRRAIGQARPVVTQGGIRLRPVRLLPPELDFLLGADVNGDGQVEMAAGSRAPDGAGVLSFYRVSGPDYEWQKLADARLSEQGNIHALAMLDGYLAVTRILRLDKTIPDKPAQMGAMRLLRVGKDFAIDTVFELEGADFLECDFAPMRFGGGRTGFVLGWGCYRRQCDIFEKVVQGPKVSYVLRNSFAYPDSKNRSDVRSVNALDADGDGDDDIAVGYTYWTDSAPSWSRWTVRLPKRSHR